MNNETFGARRTCGNIRYRTTSCPMFVHDCQCCWHHCESGAAFALTR